MKKLAMFLCSILVSASFLGSCGMVDSIEIESIKSTYNAETKVTTITITYLDDIEPPLVLEIPAGAQGVEGLQGVGIDRVETKCDANGELEAIVIHFTDPEKEPYTVPMRDGVSINDVAYEKLADGSIKLTFIGDNGEPVGESITFPAGTQISDIESKPREDGSIEVQVFYTNQEDPTTFIINSARGVKDIATNLINNQYVITFTYTDDTIQEVAFDRPAAWLSGEGAPNPADGIDGDFYFDVANKLIYQKFDGKWGNGTSSDPLVNLNPEEANKYTIKFVIAQDERLDQSIYKTEYSLLAGESFAAKGWIVPTPTHTDDIYEFAGWYTVDNDVVINVNYANFTDLTPVSGNLTLYAHWKLKA